MNRRRLLLSYLANSFSWELYSKVYFYNELVPTTINGKNVLNKAKISKIYGNGAIENQLCIDGQFTSSSGWFTIGTSGTISVSNNVATITKTASSTIYLYRANADYPTLTNHIYLHISNVKSSANGKARFTCGNAYQTAQNITANVWNKLVYIAQPTTFGGFFSAIDDVNSLGINDTLKCNFYEVIDLTLMFGTGNEPTTLTDNRIQNILNRGYIPYNTGKYKESDIGEFSTTKADTTALDTITFKAQLGGAINSHDTMEITKTNVVFTKNIGSVDLGTLSWLYESDKARFYSSGLISLMKHLEDGYEMPNMLCSKYATAKFAGTDKSICTYKNGYIYVKDSSYTDATTFKIAMSGVYLFYELATPQVITIPRKHLGIVDLGTLNWSYQSNNGRWYSNDIRSSVKTPTNDSQTPNIYTKNYMTKSYNDKQNGHIYLSTGGTLFVYTTDSVNKPNGILFYETESEVADITDTIDIESGGTITTDSEVLPNVELSVKCK